MKSDCSAASWLKFFMSAGIQKDSAETYAVTFSKNQIHLDMLPEIKKEYLVDMGITLMGHIIAILRHAKTVHTEEVTKSTLSTDKGSNNVSSKTSAPKNKPVSKTTPIIAKDKALAASTVSKGSSDRVVPKPSSAQSNAPSTSVHEKKKEKQVAKLSSQSDQVISQITPIVSRPVITRPIEPPVKRKLPDNDSMSPDESEKKRRIFQRLGQVTSSANSSDNLASSESVFQRLGQKTSVVSAETTVIASPKKVTVKPIISQPKKILTRSETSLMNNPKTKLLMLNQGVLTKTMRADQDVAPKVLSSTSLSAERISQTVQNLRIGKNIYTRLGKAAMDIEPLKPVAVTPKTKRVSFGSVSEKTIPAITRRPTRLNMNGFVSAEKFLLAKTDDVFGPKTRRHSIGPTVFSRLGT